MRVVLGEDLFLLRYALERLLETHGCEIVAAVGTGPDLLQELLRQRPDVAVVDVRMPPTFTDEGLRAALEARRRVPGLPVLVLSQYVEPLYSRELLADPAGGVGYLLKDRVMESGPFIDAVRRVAAGSVALDQEVIARMLAGQTRDEPLARLTARERTVLELMAEGLSNSGIAQHMRVSGRAVAKHIANIFAKLGLPPSDSDNRRVRAVLAYLGRGSAATG
ncbi:response regulator transcription factor [Actinomadura macrotermitis]|uniref:Oxygen regulatory protein NreC n=1 Tax=Actinomadura macrotermitis TaxID=2585200 RepID=A0A7K0C8A8_9ACTN|nr:Oxygen regulatory protein NreC [Actinomadura macrotermitis]